MSLPKQKPRNNEFIFSFFLRFLPIRKFIVHEESMQPFLQSGEIVITSFLPIMFHGVKENDVVVFSDKKTGTYFIKRVRSVNKDQVFVQGDNANVSIDSRQFGPIKMQEIIGKVIAKI